VAQRKPTPQTFSERQELSLQLAMAAARAVSDNRGQKIVVLDMRGQTAIFDFFVIATGTSQRQLRAMADGVAEVLKEEFHDKPLSVEGYQESNWILCDYGSVVVHLFDEEGRKFYRLEDLWGQATKVELPGLAGAM
jgi:ribosome-associated protein